MHKKLLLGVEAIGQGAIDGGISGVYAYPGTSSTEITEYIQENETAIERNIHRQWSANEKTAIDAENVAKTSGNVKSFNMVMLGAASPFIDLPLQSLEQAIRDIFARKGAEIVAVNLSAFYQEVLSLSKN